MSQKKATVSSPEAPHPLGMAVEDFDHAVRDIEACARLFVPQSANYMIEAYKIADAEEKNAFKVADSKDVKHKSAAYARLFDAVTRKERLLKSKIPFRLQESLFVGLFSVYDAFLGQLLCTIFSRKPQLFESIKGETKTSDILKFSSIESLKTRILEDFVDDCRRKSYIDQFSHFETLFAISLRKFTNWPRFIEAAQRRNLITHCGGVVSEQYIKVCMDVGYKFDGEPPKIGTQLKLTPKYFHDTCRIVQEVGVKLAHTLWRKLFDEELKQADEHLSMLAYNYLRNGKSYHALTIAEFAYDQKKVSSEQQKLINAVNYCIALNNSGDKSKCTAIINDFDLSSALPDFRLAKAVLLGDFKQAAVIMKQIGRQGELVTQLAYHVWPLFRDFHGSQEFQKAYRKIYRQDFLDKARKVAAEAPQEAPKVPAELKPDPKELPSAPPPPPSATTRKRARRGRAKGV